MKLERPKRRLEIRIVDMKTNKSKTFSVYESGREPDLERIARKLKETMKRI